MKLLFTLCGTALIILSVFIPQRLPAQRNMAPIPKPVTGLEVYDAQPGSHFKTPGPKFHNTYKTVSGPNASISYTTLPGIYTVYDLQSNGVPQQIWQDPIMPQFIHAVVMYSTVPGFATRGSMYFFSSDYGVTWVALGDVPAAARSGFPAITGLLNGSAVVINHNNSNSTTTHVKLYYDAGPGFGLFTELDPGVSVHGDPIWGHALALTNNNIAFVSSINGQVYSYTNTVTSLSPPGTFSGYQTYPGDQAGSYSIALAPDGTIGHAFIGSDDEDMSDVFYRQSADNGLTWSPKQRIWDWNINTDSLGCLRGVSIVFNNNNQPYVAFNTSKLTDVGFFPAEPSQVRVWSPGVNGGIPRIVADSSNVPFYPNTGEISSSFLSLCRPSIGRSSASNSIVVAFSASTQFVGSDSSRYYSAYLVHSTNAGSSWYEPERITPETPLRDWRYISVSPVNYQTSNTLTVQLICQSDSLPGAFVNGAPIGRGEFVNIRFQASTTQSPVPPALLQPQNGASVIYRPVLLDWANVANAQTYSVQLSGDSLFSNLIVNAVNLTETQYLVDTLLLNYGTRYFWRARATNSFGTSDWSNAWKFSTYQMLPLLPVLTSPPDGAVNVSVTPLLDWNDVPNATSYSVMIARDPSFAVTVFSSDTVLRSYMAVPASVLNHDSTYFWKVAGKNHFGSGQFTPPWSFTVIVEVPPAPVPLSPANGSTVYTSTPSLSWTAAISASSYKVQVSSDSSFISPIINVSNIAGTTYSVPSGILNSNLLYFWRVSGVNANGNGLWSDRWNFRTSTGTPPPVLLSPGNGQTGILLTTYLDWSNSVNAIRYDVTLATDSLFQNVILDVRSLTISQYQVPSPLLTYSTNYYWKARAIGTSGPSDWSLIWSFRTVQIGMPSTPLLLLPANNSVNVSVLAYFRWLASSNTSHYNLQVSTDSTFGAVTFGKDTILPPEFNMPDSVLSFETMYFWRVQALNHAGASNWSQVYRFRTVAFGNGLPGKPVLQSPANNSTNISAVALLNWGDAMLATGYQLDVATDLNFNNIILTSDTISLSQYKVQPGSLNHNTLYFWRVRSLNSTGAGKWSDEFAFRTALLTQLVQTNSNLPDKYGLYGNYPNPFNPSTTIKFSVPERSNAKIMIHDVNGREVAMILNEEVLPGFYSIRFDGSQLASGVYFCRMAAGSFSSAVRLILLK